MANIGLVEADDVIPEIWANTALGALVSDLQIGRLINTDFDSGDFSKMGATLHIPSRGVLSVNDKVANTPITLQTPSTSDQTLVLNKHRDVSFAIEDIVTVQQNQNLMLGYMGDSAIVLAEDIETHILTFAKTFATKLGTTGTSLDADTHVNLKRLMTEAKMPQKGRNLILGSTGTNDLLKLAKFTSAEQVGGTSELINGALRKYFGIDTFESFYTEDDATDDHNFGFHRDSMVIASRPLALPPATVGVDSVATSFGGYSMRQITGYDIKEKAFIFSLDMLYGVAKLRDPFGVDVICNNVPL